MQGRIPITTVLNAAKGSRHFIPHRTFRASMDSDFFKYLDSDDNRLPKHKALQLAPCDPQDFDTYVGEEAWEEEKEPSPPSESLQYDDVVSWVVETLAMDWAREGVLLCGRYVVANDCEWALFSRSIVAHSARDVFVLMKMSIKFSQDVHTQRKVERGGKGSGDVGGGEEGGGPYLEFTLVQSLDGPECRSMRAFVPYLLTRPRAAVEDGELAGKGSVLLQDVIRCDDHVGITQRPTEVCLPSLQEWSELEHDQNFSIVWNRIQHLGLLERMIEKNPTWWTELIASFFAEEEGEGEAANKENKKRSEETPLVLLLAIDFFFDTPTCPIFVTSAKARLFYPRDPSDYTLPFLKEEEEEEEKEEEATTAEGEESEAESSGEVSFIIEEEPPLRFFRLFRCSAHWNVYVSNVEERKKSEAAVSAPTADAVSTLLGEEERNDQTLFQNKLPSTTWRRFFVFASDFSDLIQTGEAMERMGLPLEFMKPELLKDNPQLAEVVKELLEGMNKQKVYL